MKTIIFVIAIVFIGTNIHAQNAETYQQCKRRIEGMMKIQERASGVLISPQSKKLTVKAHCLNKKK